MSSRASISSRLAGPSSSEAEYVVMARARESAAVKTSSHERGDVLRAGIEARKLPREARKLAEPRGEGIVRFVHARRELGADFADALGVRRRLLAREQRLLLAGRELRLVDLGDLMGKQVDLPSEGLLALEDGVLFLPELEELAAGEGEFLPQRRAPGEAVEQPCLLVAGERLWWSCGPCRSTRRSPSARRSASVQGEPLTNCFPAPSAGTVRFTIRRPSSTGSAPWSSSAAARRGSVAFSKTASTVAASAPVRITPCPRDSPGAG